jgi:hypothetical protein
MSSASVPAWSFTMPARVATSAVLAPFVVLLT